ncbi:DNA ligase [Campylobacter coli]|uniref:DNA ligase n=1 Tax=Campylobacter coli TaxID=195 RepID=UPI000707318D|nr:DNA ligase [Campylobacter coli]EAI1731468.1 DNA ligase [Campylobacter coli]EAI2414612.1 DNA ligase [Campylobacter coli]EAJ0317310.1 DNA ligase [Campylobacter coli]EAJ1158090.1 DNA ligase [Campylobacter coli]EAJ4098673.1 DNA ligase [Campylobacter coli]
MRIFVFLWCVSFAFASDILLLSKISEQEIQNKNFNGYLMSEKLDGVRGIWEVGKFKTRQDNPIYTPSYFTYNFPSFKLDGELWIARAKFDEVSALIRSDNLDSSLWKSVTYNVFDVPNACEEFKLTPCTLSNRLKVLERYLQQNPNPYIKIIKQIPIKDQEHLKEFYKDIVLNKGEGVVIRKNLAPYEKGRSKNAFKLKPYEDAECKVIGYTEGKGKFQGKIGALLCQMPNDRVIRIGSGLKDKDRENPPKIGSIVTYKFNGLTKNSLPRFPVFLRIRD